MMSELMAWAAGGAQGIPIPYSPRMDDGITVILLCCFFLSPATHVWPAPWCP